MPPQGGNAGRGGPWRGGPTPPDIEDLIRRSKIIVDEQTRSILPLLNLDSEKGDRQ